MFETLAAEGINIQMISTSEIKISVVVDEKYLELAVRALHQAFDLAIEDAINTPDAFRIDRLYGDHAYHTLSKKRVYVVGIGGVGSGLPRA